MTGQPILKYLDASGDVFFIVEGGARVIWPSPAGAVSLTS
jgi:hypothetical protein